MLPISVMAQTPVTPELLDQFDAQKKTVVLSNGERLAYIDAGSRDAPSLVLIHGYTESQAGESIADDWRIHRIE